MRHLLFFLLFLSFSGAWAQDYQLVRSDMVRFYDGESGQHGIRIDSLSVENGDSVLFNYITVREDGDGFSTCYYVNAPSMLGDKVLIRPNGETLLFNRYGDTLTISTQAALNETWTMMDISLDTVLRATVTAIGPQEWLGLIDMVKTITVQAVNGNGQPIDHAANGFEMLIGQQFGLLRGFDLFYFPHNEHQMGQYTVTGMEEHGVGTRRVSTAEIFDFDLCDEFHFRKSVEGYGQGPSDITYTKLRVVGKLVDTNSVTYQFDTDGCRYHYQSNWGVIPPSYTQVITPIGSHISTITYPYRWDADESRMPMQQVVVGYDSIVMTDHVALMYQLESPPQYGLLVGRSGMSYSGNNIYTYGYLYFDEEQCGLPECECLWDNSTTQSESESVAVGLGKVREAFEYYSGLNDWSRTVTDLVYYNKCGEEWGNPISEGLLTGLDEAASTKPLNLHPNPASSVLRFDSPAPTAYTVMDAVGRTVMLGQAQLGQNTLSVDGLRDGVYVLRLEDGSGAVRFVKGGQ